MSTEQMRSIVEVDPTVHFIGTVSVTPEDGKESRIGYVHRLFRLCAGHCRIRVSDTEYDLHSDDVLLVLSGTPYQILPEERGASLLSVNFNFFDHIAGAESPLYRYTTKKEFREEDRVERFRFREGILRGGFAFLRGIGELREDLNMLLREAERGEVLSDRQIRAYLLICLNRIFRRLLLSPSGEEPKRHVELLAYLAEHFAEPLDNRTIAAHFHYHPNYIGELIRGATGLPLHRYLLRLRLRRATELLSSENLPVSEVAQRVGFPNAAYFTRYFREEIGCTPTEFRKRAMM